MLLRALRRDAVWLFVLALGLRLVVALMAAERFPPADDGSFYHAVAKRIALGLGYTWAWPDGSVTYAAHYPVGYPALLGAAYALLGSRPICAMIVNALLGALLVSAAHALALCCLPPARARVVGLSLAVHPTLVLYTAALMTEVPAASVLMLLAAYALFLRASQAGWWRRVPLWLGSAALVLIRPQLLPLAPLLGAVAVVVPDGTSRLRAWLSRVRGGAEVLLMSLALCAPWTLRNCAKMDGCVFVSANGGWNLLIGTLAEGRGSFAPIAGPNVPAECREVFGEAAKDRCFGRAALGRIAHAPAAWLRLAPRKLEQLFNQAGVAGPYLRSSNPAEFSDRAERFTVALETVYSRVLLFGACVGLGLAARRRGAKALGLAGGGFAATPWGFAGQLCLLAALAWERPSPGRRPLEFLAAAVLALCVVTHIVFFGAARYALIWTPWLPLLMLRRAESFDRPSLGGR